jgi:hypothetical protein
MLVFLPSGCFKIETGYRQWAGSFLFYVEGGPNPLALLTRIFKFPESYAPLQDLLGIGHVRPDLFFCFIDMYIILNNHENLLGNKKPLEFSSGGDELDRTALLISFARNRRY